jgi:hypothetical protein
MLECGLVQAFFDSSVHGNPAIFKNLYFKDDPIKPHPGCCCSRAQGILDPAQLAAGGEYVGVQVFSSTGQTQVLAALATWHSRAFSLSSLSAMNSSTPQGWAGWASTHSWASFFVGKNT